MKKSAQGVPVKPPCRKSLKKPAIPKDALRVGPFVLEKGRGENWRLKSVRGVRFVIQPSTMLNGGFLACLTSRHLVGSANYVRGVSPVAAGQAALTQACAYLKQDLRDARRMFALTAREIEDNERTLELLRTGKPPQVDRVKPVRRKR